MIIYNKCTLTDCETHNHDNTFPAIIVKLSTISKNRRVRQKNYTPGNNDHANAFDFCFDSLTQTIDVIKTVFVFLCY